MKLLIVIDMQNDFIDGSLGTKEAVAIVPNVAKKIASARAAGETVIFTSGSFALRINALLITQIPVQSPTSSISSRFPKVAT